MSPARPSLAWIRQAGLSILVEPEQWIGDQIARRPRASAFLLPPIDYGGGYALRPCISPDV